LKQLGLSASERIKRKIEFNLVYSRGEFFFSRSNRLKAAFYIDRNPETAGIKAAFAVSKKSGNAVWRNRLKRLLRESYRLNKADLILRCKEKKAKLLIVFSSNTLNETNSKKIKLSDIEDDVVDLLNQIGIKL
jgi:ribonuclease P protein component